MVAIAATYYIRGRRRSTGSRNGKVRVQGQHDGRRAAVGHGLLDRIIGKRVPVAHRDVALVVRTQSRLEQPSLLRRIFQNGRAAADRIVGRPRFRGSALGYEPGDRGLEARERGRQANNVGVREQVVEEGLDVFTRFRAAEIQQQDGDGALVRFCWLLHGELGDGGAS